MGKEKGKNPGRVGGDGVYQQLGMLDHLSRSVVDRGGSRSIAHRETSKESFPQTKERDIAAKLAARERRFQNKEHQARAQHHKTDAPEAAEQTPSCDAPEAEEEGQIPPPDPEPANNNNNNNELVPEPPERKPYRKPTTREKFVLRLPRDLYCSEEEFCDEKVPPHGQGLSRKVEFWNSHRRPQRQQERRKGKKARTEGRFGFGKSREGFDWDEGWDSEENVDVDVEKGEGGMEGGMEGEVEGEVE